MNSKNWWESKTIWGAVVVVIAALAQLFGKTISDADQTNLIDALCTLSQVLGGVVIAWGRMTATTTINPTKPPNQLSMLAAVGALSLFLGGCTGLAVNNTQDAIGIGYTTIKTVANGIAIAKGNGQITAAQRDEWLAQVQEAKNDLDAATAALSSNATTANTQLQAATAILQTIQQALLRAQQNGGRTDNSFRSVITGSVSRAGWREYRLVHGVEEAGRCGRSAFIGGRLASVS